MGYAVKPNGSYRAVAFGTALESDETYSETAPAPVNQAQQPRISNSATLDDLKRQLTVATTQGDLKKQNKLRREISRLKYMSQGV